MFWFSSRRGNQVSEKIIRLPKVKEMVGLGTTAIYDKMKKGEFPKQIKLGRLSGWVESEIQAWITQRITASRLEQAANFDLQAQAA
jgi:prophage regulatory protein